jgi:integrase/recombinase XerD
MTCLLELAWRARKPLESWANSGSDQNEQDGCRHADDWEAAMPGYTQDNFTLHGPHGDRKYINRPERRRVLLAMRRLRRERHLFSVLLTYSGARISEVLAVCPSSFQLDSSVVALRTLKRRRHHVREVPIPPELMAAIDWHFGIRELQYDPGKANSRLWSFSRVTAWRFVKEAIMEAGVVGRAACPRGLRHGFGVGTLQAGVPLNLVQSWMGHARLSTTAIYANASGPEEIAFAEKFWQESELGGLSELVANEA